MNKKYSFLALAAVAVCCFAPKAEASWFSFGLDISSQCAPSVGYCPSGYAVAPRPVVHACPPPVVHVCPPPAPHHHCHRPAAPAPHRLPAPMPAPQHHSRVSYFK